MMEDEDDDYDADADSEGDFENPGPLHSRRRQNPDDEVLPEADGVGPAERARRERLGAGRRATAQRQAAERADPYAPVRVGYLIELYQSPRFAALEPSIKCRSSGLGGVGVGGEERPTAPGSAQSSSRDASSSASSAEKSSSLASSSSSITWPAPPHDTHRV